MKVLESCVYHEVRQMRCHHCKSLLEYDERDVKTPRQSDLCDLKFITCPECGKVSVIKDESK